MSRSEPSLEPQLARLRAHLREERYSRWVTWNYVTAARRFLRALERRGQPLESVSAADVERYLDGLKRQRDRLTLPAPWRRQHQAAIHMLLRLVHGKWPPEIAPTTADEIAMHEVICDYDAWMVELRGLSASTREHGRTEARSASAMALRSRQERCHTVRRGARRVCRLARCLDASDLHRAGDQHAARRAALFARERPDAGGSGRHD